MNIERDAGRSQSKEMNKLTITYSPPKPGKPSRAHYLLRIASATDGAIQREIYGGRNLTELLREIRRRGLALPAGSSLDRACIIELVPLVKKRPPGRPRGITRTRVSTTLDEAELAILEKATGERYADKLRSLIEHFRFTS